MSESSLVREAVRHAEKTVGVVIATRNRPDPLQRCFESLIRQTRSAECTVIVDSSDNNATQKLTAEFADRIPGLRWIRSPFASAAGQRNLGAERINSDVVLFLDDDVVLDASFIAEIMNVFEDTAQTAPGGVSGTITNQVYTDPKGINRLLLALCIGRLSGSYAGKLVGPAVNFLPEDVPDTVQDVEWLPTTCTAYDRRIFLSERFGSFEGYSFAEDVHLSSRVGRTHRLVNTSKARVYHEDLGQHTHKDWFAIGRSQVLNRHLILTSVLGRSGLGDMIRLLAYEMLYCPIAYFAAGATKERRIIARRLMAGKWHGFRTLWRG